RRRSRCADCRRELHEGYLYPVSCGFGSRSWEVEECVFRGSLHVLKWNLRREKRGTLTNVGARQDQGGSWKAKRGPCGKLSASGARRGGVVGVTKVDDTTVSRS